MKIATIVMAHADTEFRKKLLKECLLSINTPIILSTNFPVSHDIQLLCDHVIYTKENPIVKKEEYAKFNMSFNYWELNDKGEKIYTPMEYEHGFAAYCLIRNGIEYAETKKFDTIHCINYDYEINKNTLILHKQYLKSHKLVMYMYDKNIDYDNFGTDKYSTGFFSGKVDTLKTFFTKFNNKQDYYVTDGFSILERKIYEHYKLELVKELKYSDLEKTEKTNQEGVLMFSKSNKSKTNNMRILFLAPHLSTGGMPAFLLKRIEALQANNDVEIFVVEYQCHSLDYVVQRNAIMKLTTVYHLEEDKMVLFDMIKDFNPDVIHIDEMSERLDREMITKLYSNNRTYRIVETCHDVSFQPEQEKIFIPDAYAFCSPYHLDTFNNVDGYREVIEFPIDNYKVSEEDVYETKIALGMNLKMKHVVNIGLWTPGKNQGEMLELAKLMPDVGFHFVGNQAGNFEHYWGPLMNDIPDNVKIWGERDDAKYFLMAADVFMFNSTWECNPLVLREAISFGKPILARNLPQYKNMFTEYITDIKDPKTQLEMLLNNNKAYVIPTGNTSKDFANNHINLYKKTMSVIPSKNDVKDYNIIQHFVRQPFLEITGTSDSTFDVEFYDLKKQILVHYDTIKCNHWIKLNREYYTKWETRVYKDGVLVYTNVLDYTDKRVYISFDSSSLGDTIAWMPYVLEFKKKHNCHVIVSTFKNFLFESVYPELEFVTPGIAVNNIYGMYKLGWFYNKFKEPVLPNTIPLQQTATNILGLEYKEIKPRIILLPSKHISKKYVTIATNSTAGCKFWTKENWQEIINYLISKGYDVINTSLEDNPFDNCIVLADKSMNSTIECINDSEFFIGLSSGLSWLAWALDKEIGRAHV